MIWSSAKREHRYFRREFCRCLLGKFFLKTLKHFYRLAIICKPESASIRLKVFKSLFFRASFSKTACNTLEKRGFLLGLLGNQNLLEHDGFTEMLWAVFHLTEEFANRSSLDNLHANDKLHLEGDIKRAYTTLTGEWLDYMMYLKSSYPYLFSLAMRTNPYNERAVVYVS